MPNRNQNEIDSYQIKTAKTGEKIPVVNDVHLHSSYSPMREAEAFIKQYGETILSKKNILILGLGFGYHIHKAIELFQQNNISDFQISIIEPNERVIKDCLTINPFDNDRIKIFSYRNVSRLYSHKDLIDRLLTKPAIIPHTSSFNLYKSFYRDFLTYEADQSLKTAKSFVNDEELLLHIENYNEELSLNDAFLNKVKGRRIDNQFDYLLLAFGKITEQVKVGRQ